MTEKAKTSATRNDLILVIALLLIALIGLILVFLTRTEGAYCVITQNGEVLDKLSLSEPSTHSYYADNGAYNTVTVENGSVYITEASCPDKLCVKRNTVKYHGQTIVCLPNGFVVTVYGVEDGLDIIV